MYAKYYERKRTGVQGYDDKPMLETIFAHKSEARLNEKAVKTIFMTQDEFEDLQGEIKKVGHDINFVKLLNDLETITKLIGIPIEIVDELQKSVDKVA